MCDEKNSVVVHIFMNFEKSNFASPFLHLKKIRVLKICGKVGHEI